MLFEIYVWEWNKVNVFKQNNLLLENFYKYKICKNVVFIKLFLKGHLI